MIDKTMFKSLSHYDWRNIHDNTIYVLGSYNMQNEVTIVNVLTGNYKKISFDTFKEDYTRHPKGTYHEG